MAITYSIDQQRIIDSRGKNLLVPAAAGSGKTAVLTKRVIERVMDKTHPIDIDKILVLTYTNAAAKEMKERILDAINDAIAQNPQDSHLAKQATLIHGAYITTIDSFCLSVIRNHFHKIGLDPSFRIAGEGEAELIGEDVLKQVMEEAYASESEDFYHLIDCYTKKDKDDTVEDSIKTLYRFAMSYPWPIQWLDMVGGEYSFADEDELRSSAVMKEVYSLTKDGIEKIEALMDAMQEVCEDPMGPAELLVTLEADREMLSKVKEALESYDYSKIRDAFGAAEFVTAKKTKECSQPLKDRASGYRNSYKKLFTNLKEQYYTKPLAEHFHEMNETGRVVKTMTELVKNYIRAFDAAKRDAGIIDFTDMSHMAIQILCNAKEGTNRILPSEVAIEYQNYFEEVMVDEYQDANLVQEIILRTVSHEDCPDLTPNRFMVGDVKQSIYKFRLARPQIFMEKQENYKLPTQDCEMIVLKENYRSRKGVIDSVNAVFEGCMSKRLGGCDYDADARLYYKADYPEEDANEKAQNKTELILVNKEEMSTDEVRKFQVYLVANRIIEECKTRLIYDKKSKTYRPATYKDFCIMARSVKTWAPYVKDVFGRLKIPYTMNQSLGFFEAREIKEVMNFLSILNNPLDDIALYGAMVSFFGQFSDEEIAQIKALYADCGYYLWDKLKLYHEDYKDDSKVNAFLKRVEGYRELSLYTPIAKLIITLLDETGYKCYVAALPDGKQREANIELLIRRARDYAKTSFYGLFYFLRYVELLRKNSKEEGEAGVSGEDSDAVSIITIHAGKGLEYPVCFVMGMEDSFNKRAFSAPFLLDIDAGIGAKYIDPKRRVMSSTLKRNLILDKQKVEALGEEIRVFYVAMTRAREKLFLVGSDKDAINYLSNPGVTLDYDSYMDLVKPALFGDSKDFFDTKIECLDSHEYDMLAKEIESTILRDYQNRNDLSENTKAIVETLKERLTYTYPHEELKDLYTKTTVSELKYAAMEDTMGEAAHAFISPEQEEIIPVFAGGKEEISGTDRGTAYHKLLCAYDYTKKPSESAWNEQMTELVNSGAITREEKDMVPMGRIRSFLESDVALRMHKAALMGKLYKEQPFVLGIPASVLNKELPADETVLIQGVIDVWFEEDKKAVVLDYKTDRVDTDTELIARYETQLQYYAKALEQLTHIPVEERLIYSFGLNKTIVVK